MRIKEKKEFFIIVRSDGLAYSGLINGRMQWTHEWNKAKPLERNHTGYVLRLNPDSELINEAEL